MNINPTNCNFQSRLPKTRFALKTKDGGLMDVEVVGNLGKKVTEINCTTVDKVKNYHNKKGLSFNRIMKISNEVQKNIDDGFEFLAEFIKAQF